MSSSPPPGPPPPGPPPSGPPLPMASSPGSSPPPPPPPPPNSSDNANAVSSITSANYFFGFVITFVVLLLLFVGCGIGSWRRFRLVGTAWDERLQDMDGVPYAPRKRGRRRLVRPVFAEAWTKPETMKEFAVGAVTSEDKWDGVQPISAAFVWSRSTLSAFARQVKASQRSTRCNDGSTQSLGTMLRAFLLPRGPRCEHPPRPLSIPRPPPEAIQVAVMISMPLPPELKRNVRPLTGTDGERCVGHAGVGEYQIGIVRMPWPSGEGP